MKKLLIILAVAVFIGGTLGCQASTLSSKGLDGATLKLENYVVKETIIYNSGGKITSVKKTMIPSKSVLEAVVDKVVTAMKNFLEIIDIQDDVAGDVADILIP